MQELIDAFAVFRAPLSELPAELAVAAGLWAFFFGSTIGSFLNVVIARVPAGLSVVRPRSRCPKCKSELAWYDNVPVFSWLVLRGKCRSCKTPISIRYPVVELLGGACALVCAARFGFSLAGLEVFIFCMLMIVVAYIDIDTWTIPMFTTYSLWGLGLFFGVRDALSETPVGATLPSSFIESGMDAAISRALGAAIGFVGLWAFATLATVLYRRSGRLGPDETAMGLGDAFLLSAIGGVLGLPALAIVVFLGSLQGSVVGLALQYMGRLHKAGVPVEGDPEDWSPPDVAIQYGPFLALAGVETAFFGAQLLDWASGRLFLGG